MSLPKQVPPVRRPEIVEPHRVVEVERGSPHQLLRARMLLMHGANFNDPAKYAPPDAMRMRLSASTERPTMASRVEPVVATALAAALPAWRSLA